MNGHVSSLGISHIHQSKEDKSVGNMGQRMMKPGFNDLPDLTWWYGRRGDAMKLERMERRDDLRILYGISVYEFPFLGQSLFLFAVSHEVGGVFGFCSPSRFLFVPVYK